MKVVSTIDCSVMEDAIVRTALMSLTVVCYTDPPWGAVDPLTSDNTPPPHQTPSRRVHHPIDTVNHKMHKIWSVDSQENY